MQKNKQYYLFYLWDIPRSLSQTFVRTLLFVFIFGVLELGEEYFFGSNFDEALTTAINFIINIFQTLFILFFLMTVIPRVKSQYDFLRKLRGENKTARELYLTWLNKS